MMTPAVANVVQRARYVTWRKMMSSEQAFFAWYDRIKEAGMEDNYNMRMSFDAGYYAALKELEDE
jgi:hypothetical protein